MVTVRELEMALNLEPLPSSELEMVSAELFQLADLFLQNQFLQVQSHL